MPWGSCQNSWNTRFCSERMRIGNSTNEKEIYVSEIRDLSSMNKSQQDFVKTSSASEYYNIYMLGINHSNGLTDLGLIKIDVLLCLIGVFIVMYMCIYRGVKSTGKDLFFCF